MTDAAVETSASTHVVRGRWRATVPDVLHAAALATLVVLLRTGADRWAWATVLAYAPRWPWLVPGGLLATLAVLRRRVPWLTTLAVLACGWVLLDAHATVGTAAADGTALRVLTLNCDGGNTADRGTEPTRIGRLIADVRPDVVLLQEWDLAGMPPMPRGNWTQRRLGNVSLLSRYPVTANAALPTAALGGQSGILGARLSLPDGRAVWVFTPHLETPRRGFTHLLQRRADAFALLTRQIQRRQWVSEQAVAFVRHTAGDGDLIVAGDFNLVADGRIFATTWARFADAFATAGTGTGGTKLQAGWRPRIDHVLCGGAWRVTRCWVGPDVGSDHLPLIADLRRVLP